MMKRLIKAGLMVLMGIVIWINGSMVKEASAEPWGNGICKAGWNVTYDSGDTYCVLPGGSCQYHPSGSLPACAQDQPTNPKPVVKKPSSYGAVAWDIKRGLLGTASKQASKQASINAALQKCGAQTCEISMLYSNQCTAVGYGIDKTGKQKYIWQVSAGLTKSKAERAAIADCSEVANNCKIALSECSPAGEIDSAQQYKGLGE